MNDEDDLDSNIKFIKSVIELKSLSSDIKKDNSNNNFEGCIIPKKIKLTDFIICIENKKSKNICSFIWFGIYNNEIFYDVNLGKKMYLHINYSYTFNKYRNKGLNKSLRLWIENWCVKNRIEYILSVPLPNSNSKYILEKLNYRKINTHYIKKIFINN